MFGSRHGGAETIVLFVRDMSAALTRLAGEATDSLAWRPVREFLARFGSG